jgi:NitT/TauT family transport system substrate-binding protein
MKTKTISAFGRTAIGLAAGVLMTMAFATAPAKALEHVTISHASATLLRLPFYIAYQNGYFKDEGLEVEIIETSSGSDALKLLAGGAVNFSVGQLIDSVNANKQDLPIKGVAMLTNQFGNQIIVQKKLEGQVKTIADLKGKIVGVTGVGSGTWQLVAYLAKQAGMTMEDFNIVSVGGAPNIIAAVTSGRVDGMSYSDPETYKLVHDGNAFNLIDMTDPATHKKYIGDSYLNNEIMIRTDWAKAHTATVQGFVNAIQRGLNWSRSHPVEEVAKLLQTFPGFSGTEPDIFLGSLRRLVPGSLPATAIVTHDAFDNALRLPIGAGVLDKALPFDTLIDNSFAEAAAKKYPPGQ